MFVPTGPPGLPGVPGMNCSCDLTGRVNRAAGTFGGLAGSNGRIEGRGEIDVHIMHCVIYFTSGMFTCLTSFTIHLCKFLMHSIMYNAGKSTLPVHLQFANTLDAHTFFVLCSQCWTDPCTVLSNPTVSRL